ncbi:hypothetical protein CMP1-29 [Clavibacter phage CMP1]|uniref:Uncharacterized protein n=1 Tax=Clavibacter phage CMP1 TaxID=686439 RepID=D0U213_9CAUD|nr:hypothetical protein CMP1-29 [Clavibacter phage CMP1]ACY35925.1 hypothetical protein CMP1-29 [Clavibacter phage CMP1]
MLRYQTMDATLQKLNDNIAALPSEDPNHANLLEQYNTLEESYIELRAKLLENSIIIHLRSIPQVTLDAIQSKTVRKWANISKEREKTEDPLTQGEAQIYMQRDHAQGIIRAAIQKIEAADGSQAELPETIGKDLAELLSPAEFQRLDNAIQEMVFNDNLGRLATDEPGF